jgi:putative transposase
MKFRFIAAHRARYGVGRLCALLQVSRSGFYAAQQRPAPARPLANAALLVHIREVHRHSRGTYGAPRVHSELVARGHRCGRHRVARLMRVHGIHARRVRRWRPARTAAPAVPVAPNLLARRFARPPARTVWLADTTYIPTGEGWTYLAVVLDLRTRLVVGWSAQATFTEALPLAALEMALGRQVVGGEALHHSDRGVQYLGRAYQQRVRGAGFSLSMSATGSCYDNAVVESFFHTLKTELIHHERYATRGAAQASVFEYIEGFYNRERRHSALGYCAPAEYAARISAP